MGDDGSGDDSITTCQYTKYPEWEGLKDVYAMSDAQIIGTQTRGLIPACPERFPALSFYDWPTDEGDDPELEYCLDLQRTDSPTETAPVDSPTMDPTTNPTDGSNTSGTDAPSVFLTTNES